MFSIENMYVVVSPRTFGIGQSWLELEPFFPKLSRLPCRLRFELQRRVQPEHRGRCPPMGDSDAADHDRQKFLELVRVECLGAKPRTVRERAGVYPSKINLHNMHVRF